MFTLQELGLIEDGKAKMMTIEEYCRLYRHAEPDIFEELVLGMYMHEGLIAHDDTHIIIQLEEWELMA